MSESIKDLIAQLERGRISADEFKSLADAAVDRVVESGSESTLRGDQLGSDEIETAARKARRL